jgi:hypothetical protein
MNSTINDIQSYSTKIFYFSIFVLTPFETLINFLHSFIVYKASFERTAAKRMLINYLALNVLALNFSSLSYYVRIQWPSSIFCYIAFYVSSVFINWSIFLLVFLVFKRYFSQSISPIYKSGWELELVSSNLTTLILSILFNLPILLIGRNRHNSFQNDQYLNDCKCFNVHDLIMLDFFELILCILFPFFSTLGLNTVISFKLIRSKRTLCPHVTSTTATNPNRVHRKLLARSLRFILKLYSINIFGCLLKLPLFLTRLFKHLHYSNNFDLAKSTASRAIEVFFLIESITFIVRSVYYVFTFLINISFNEMFRKQTIETCI